MARYGVFLLRLFVGAIFVLHGLENLFGLFGGGLGPLTASLSSVGARPAYALAAAGAAVQLAGGVLLMVGALTVWVTAVLAIAKALVLYRFYLATGLITALRVGDGREALELHFLLFAALIALALIGPGAFSLDERRARR